MKLLLAKHLWSYEGAPIASYATSLSKALTAAGHEVTEVSKAIFENKDDYKKYDFLLDIDCGKNMKGEHQFHIASQDKLPIKTIFFAVDSHGNPDMHQLLARSADHVFFAVWDRRDLFADHPSATWTPSFTDLEWFDGEKYTADKKYDFGFFGSRHGLDRADKLKTYADQIGCTYDIDEIGRKGKHCWPRTAMRMAACRFGFNHGQKHDSPNLRVMETMAMKLPLLTDRDPRSGMGYLFEPWQHYIPYEYDYEGLEKGMKWCLDNPEKAAKIGEQGYEEIKLNHLAEHRIKTILEIIQ